MICISENVWLSSFDFIVIYEVSDGSLPCDTAVVESVSIHLMFSLCDMHI